jgi:hypothetical protein
VSSSMRCLLVRSVMKRRPVLVQASSCWRKEHGGVHFCTLSPKRRWYQQRVDCAGPSPLGEGLSQVRLLRECERRRVRLKVRDATWPRAPLFVGLSLRFLKLARSTQSWAVARLRRSGPPVAMRSPNRPQTGRLVWTKCGAGACWTICRGGSRPVLPVRGS